MKQIQQPAYDYSKLIASAKRESQYECFSTFIEEKIHECRNEYYAGEVGRLNRYTLADMIGINASTLTKIINGSQGTRKRDLIIALCFALRMSESDAELALNLYPMAPLNRNNLRDLVIIQALRDGVSVRQLDDILATHGFPGLNVLRGDGKREERSLYIPLSSTAYEELSVDVLPYSAGEADAALSLHDRYHLERYNYRSEMIIQKKGKDGPLYRITSYGNDHYDIDIQAGEGWNHLYSSVCLHQKYSGAKSCEDPELLNEITKLKEYTDRKARYVRNMCNDTRNYMSRFDAVNDHGRLVVYGEGFGFDAPELSEYFQLEASSDGCRFTVSHTSRFLERYLGPEKWMKLYRTPPSSVIQTFASLDDVTNQRWNDQFQKLLHSAHDLLEQLRARKLFLFNARAWLDIDDLMHLYNVEEAFECYQPDDLPYEIVPKREQIIGPDGKTICIDDLYRAAELDISSLEELCAIRTRYGSLERFLNIDALTAQKGAYHE